MQTPVEIEYQGMEARPHIQAALAKHVDDLEQRFGRVTCPFQKSYPDVLMM